MAHDKPGGKTVILQVLRGVDNSITSIAATISGALSRGGFTSNLLLLRECAAPEWAPSFSEVRGLGLPNSYWGGLRVRLFLRLHRAIKDSAAEVIVVHRYKELIQLLIINRVFPGRRIVAVIHGERDFNSAFRRHICSLLIDDSCRFVAVSEGVNHYLKKKLPGLGEGRIVTINNGVDFEKVEASLWAKSRARETLAIPADALVFGSVGRLAKTKGTDILVRAFADVIKHNIPAHLVLMGEGGERKNIEQLVVELGLQGKVLLQGNIPEAYKFLGAFDYFVFPSIREGFGLAVVEAFAARVPVIFSDLDVFQDLSSDHSYMVPAGDVSALAEKMKSITRDDPARVSRITQAQYAHASENFALETTTRSYEAFFSGLLS